MIDVSVIWQKIKLIFSFLKFPRWISKKIKFYYMLYKFKHLPKDKQEFLINIHEGKIPITEYFYQNNKNLLKCMEIDGFIEIQYFPSEEREDYYERQYFTEAYYSYHLTANYSTVLIYIWRKNQDIFFKKTKIIYDDEVPF